MIFFDKLFVIFVWFTKLAAWLIWRCVAVCGVSTQGFVESSPGTSSLEPPGFLKTKDKDDNKIIRTLVKLRFYNNKHFEEFSVTANTQSFLKTIVKLKTKILAPTLTKSLRI